MEEEVDELVVLALDVLAESDLLEEPDLSEPFEEEPEPEPSLEEDEPAAGADSVLWPLDDPLRESLR